MVSPKPNSLTADFIRVDNQENKIGTLGIPKTWGSRNAGYGNGF
jgi:hypothetical protein